MVFYPVILIETKKKNKTYSKITKANILFYIYFIELII